MNTSLIEVDFSSLRYVFDKCGMSSLCVFFWICSRECYKFFVSYNDFAKRTFTQYPFSKMKSIKKDNAIPRAREKYISPDLEVYSMELETGLATSPGTPGDDDDITDLGGY